MTVFTRGAQSGARYSTLYYAEAAGGAYSDIATDLSQYLTDITEGAGNDVAYETSTGRMDWMASDGRRTIRIHCEMDNKTEGTFFRHGSTNRERLWLSSAGNLRVDLNGSTYTYAITDIGGSAEEFYILWQTIPNPDTTGASDAMRSFLVIYNEPNATVQRETFTHPVKAAETQTAYWGASDSAGGTPFTGTLYKVGYDRDFISLTQWIGSGGSVPATSLVQEKEPHPMAESGLGAAGEFYGPSVRHCTRMHRNAVRRCTSPLVNERYASPATVSPTLLIGSEIIPTPDSDVYAFWLPWTWHAPIPETINVAWVQVHCLSYVTTGAAVPFGIRLYSMDAPPGSPDLSDLRFVGEVVTRDDTVSGAGQWDIEDITEIVRDADGWSYFALAVAIDPNAASSNDANQRAVISAVSVLPRSQAPTQGGLGYGGFDAG